MSLQCIESNYDDQEKCKIFFDNYKSCNKFWVNNLFNIKTCNRLLVKF
jgi:hypothetical protein